MASSLLNDSNGCSLSNSGLDQDMEKHAHTRALPWVLRSEEIAMKTITSALVALLLVAGATSAANALDAKSFYEQVDRDHY